MSNSLSLYDLGSEYQRLIPQLYDPETGEVNQEVDAQLNALSPTSEQKCIAVASWIENMKSEKAHIEHMKQQILRREQAYENEIIEKEEYLKKNMIRCGIKEIKCPYFKIKITYNPYSTKVFDKNIIPERFIKTKEVTKTNVSIDLMAIKEEVLRTGISVPGAVVQKKSNVVISVDKI